MIFSWLWKDGVVVRKVDSWLWWISLALGTKIIIVYSIILFLGQETMYVYRFFNVENGRAKCDSLAFLHDHLWDLFNGRISLFSVILFVLDTIFSLLFWITGILTWTKKFRVQMLEWFFTPILLLLISKL